MFVQLTHGDIILFMSAMPADREVDRIRGVYQAYRKSRPAQAKWDSGNRGNRAMLRERQRAIARCLSTQGYAPLADSKVLEIGCGSGGILANLVSLGARSENLYGIDLLEEEIAVAERAYPDMHWHCANAESLSFPNCFFDLVLLFTVFSSILDTRMATNLAKEVHRVLRPGGAILWYDFRYNNPANPHVQGIPRRRIRRLFPAFELRLGSITLLPQLARRLGWGTAALYPILAAFPPLRTHYLGLLRNGGQVHPSEDGSE